MSVFHPDGWTAQQARLRAFSPLLAWADKVRPSRRALLGMGVYARKQGDQRKFAAKALAVVRRSRPPISEPVNVANLWRAYWENVK